MKLLLTAKLSDYKLTSKIIGLLGLPTVKTIYLVRSKPIDLANEKLININPAHSILKKRILFEIWRVWKIYRISKTESIKAIIGIQLIFHGIWAVLIGRRTQTPSIISLIGADIHKHTSHKIIGPIIRRVIKIATVVTVMGPRSFSIVTKIRNSSKNIYKALNFQDQERFRSFDCDKEWDLIYIGYLIPRKRVDVILKTIMNTKSIFPNIRLAIVGEGTEENKLKKLAVKAGIIKNVCFLGKKKNVEEYLNRSRILILSSKIEALPAVALEAMFCRIPCVMMDVCDIPEVFTHEDNCLLVDADDKKGFENAISRLLTDQKLYRKIVENLAITRANYIKKWGVKGQVKLWESILYTNGGYRTDVVS